MARILVLDDIRGVRRSIVGILARAGHQPEEVATAQDAFDRLDRGGVDLLITDILMPDTDGIEVIDAVRKRHRGMPILAVSGGGSLVASDQALSLAQALADDVLAKPFEGPELLAKIDPLLNGGAKR